MFGAQRRSLRYPARHGFEVSKTSHSDLVGVPRTRRSRRPNKVAHRYKKWHHRCTAFPEARWRNARHYRL